MKSDAVAKHIVAGLRKAGCSWEYWVPFGRQKGVPDGVAGFGGYNYFMEFKDPKTGKVSDDQRTWQENWKGDKVYVVTTLEEALKVIGLEPL